VNVGDTVKVSVEGKAGHIVGVVSRTWSISGRPAFQVHYMNNWLSMNEHDVTVEILAAAEPEEIGSIFYDEYNNPWTKFSNLNGIEKNWIGESGITTTWEGLQP
jgi:antirestriction protein ArdC